MTDDPTTQPPNAPHRIVGQRVPKLDALDKATGQAVYGHDVHLPGMLVGKILYARVPHARIVAIDVSRAMKLPGVKAVTNLIEIEPATQPPQLHADIGRT